MPDILETLHDTVQAGAGSPPSVDVLRRRATARRRRRLMPVGSVVAASVLAVGTVAIVHAAGRGAGLHRGGGPAASTTTIPRPKAPAVVVDTSLTPPGWVAIDWGDVQVSVPAGWYVNDPCESPSINLGLEGQGTNCTYRGESNVIYFDSLLGNEPTDSTINGFRVAKWTAELTRSSDISSMTIAPKWSIAVPSLHAIISGVGHQAFTDVSRTLTYSPRDALFSDGAPPSPPSTWSTISFEGLSFQVPPADFNEGNTSQYPLYPCTSPLYSLPWGVQEDTDTVEMVPACIDMQPMTPTTFVHAEPGVLVDARVSAGGWDAGKEGHCFLLNKLDMCPYSFAYDVLYLKVSGGALAHALLVRIGLSGNGLVTRQILYSMHSA